MKNEIYNFEDRRLEIAVPAWPRRSLVKRRGAGLLHRVLAKLRPRQRHDKTVEQMRLQGM